MRTRAQKQPEVEVWELPSAGMRTGYGAANTRPLRDPLQLGPLPVVE